jgi:hypothetical protein
MSSTFVIVFNFSTVAGRLEFYFRHFGNAWTLCAIMKVLKFFGLLILTSCTSSSNEPESAFKRLLPDTVTTWSGRMTSQDFHETRLLEKKFRLSSMLDGSPKEEIRIWNLSGFYDPNGLLILRQFNQDMWKLRAISFDRTKSDSIVNDFTRNISSNSVDSLQISHFWSTNSQSDMKHGDAYGCVDGENVFVEISDPTKYRFMWYRCPYMHRDKDSAFLLISELQNKLSTVIAR